MTAVSPEIVFARTFALESAFTSLKTHNDSRLEGNLVLYPGE